MSAVLSPISPLSEAPSAGEPRLANTSLLLAEAPIGESYDPSPELLQLATERYSREQHLDSIKTDLALLFPEKAGEISSIAVHSWDWIGSAEQRPGSTSVTIQSLGFTNDARREIFSAQRLDDEVLLEVVSAPSQLTDIEAASTARYTTNILADQHFAITDFFSKRGEVTSPEAVVTALGQMDPAGPPTAYNRVSFTSAAGDQIIFSSSGGLSAFVEGRVPPTETTYPIAVEARSAQGLTGMVIYSYQYDPKTSTWSLQSAEPAFEQGREVVDQVAGRLFGANQ